MQPPESQQRDRLSTATGATGATGGVTAADPGVNGSSRADAGVPSPVEVHIHADPALIPSVRAVAADLAARADFDLDAVSDLRMAVDEACSALVGLAASGGRLRVGFNVGDGTIEVVCHVPVDGERTLRQDTFGWRVLATLTDAAEVVDGEPGSLGIRLRKDRFAA